MNIADIREKCKKTLAAIPRDILIISILLLASITSFCLGFLAGRDYKLLGQGSGFSTEGARSPTNTSEEVVASKAGTKYYPPTCAGAKRISKENRIYFASPYLARAQGYEPADNCTGL